MLPAGLLFRCAYVYPKMYPNTAELPVAVGLFPINGRVTFVGLVPLNAPAPIIVTLLGIIILVIVLQPLNAFAPMLVTPFGIYKSVSLKEEQPLKAF